MTLPSSISGQKWLAMPEVRALMQALPVARFVGGCVRNALLGLPVDDIDIATPLTPDAVTAAVTAQGMKAIDTGVEHGTVTVVANGHPFEVTTLRRDVSTDGRRATVAFTTLWEEDASRRDFTINALYADMDGRVHDYHDGIADLQQGRVRFIGDADRRIAEDHLRILRLFRIHSWYGRGEIDAVALTACRAARGMIGKLSGERIQKEMLKLLRARHPVHALRSMRDVHVLEEVIPGDIDLEPLARLCELDARNGLAPDAILRLCGLMRGGAAVNELASRWRLSNDDRARLSLFFKVGVLLDFPLDDAALAPALYRHGAAAIGGLLKLDWARSGDPLDDPRRLKTLRFVETWRRPVLPVDGGDVLRAGIPEGPLVGGVLGTLEDWWIQAGFPVDADIVRRRLHEIVAGTKAF